MPFPRAIWVLFFNHDGLWLKMWKFRVSPPRKVEGWRRIRPKHIHEYNNKQYADFIHSEASTLNDN